MPLSSVLGAASVIKAGVVTSGTRPSVPYAGQLVYETDTNLLKAWNGTAWKTLSYSNYANGAVLQVASTTKTDTFTMSSSTYTDVTGLSVSITPTSSTSKILVSYSISGSQDNAVTMAYARLMRDSTPIAIGDASGSRIQCTTNWYANGIYTAINTSISHLDSPATTSSITYKVQVRNEASGTVYINRSSNDTNGVSGPRSVSTITVMEIAA